MNISLINKIDENTITKTFSNKHIGIIDIINKCYRKNDTSSLDEHLSIVEFYNIQNLLYDFKNISVILTTSSKVRDLLFKNQVNALRIGNIEQEILNNIEFEKLLLFERNILVKKLPSPSRRNTQREEEKLEEYKNIFREALTYINFKLPQ